jgi:hypothetical protein
MTCMGRDDVKRRRTVNPLARMSPPPVGQRDTYQPTTTNYPREYLLTRPSAKIVT